ncbi:hypothetical protein KY349_00680 [Candidatus Woesearchaeota archaeon]|nr:hypothetical protein [Candidatus Woesearchaeota archaeon]
MKILRNCLFAGIMALVAGCQGGEKPKTIQGNETVLRVGDKVKAYADLNGDGRLDLYCSGDASTSHPYDHNTMRWDKGAECHVSPDYKKSAKGAAEYEARFHQSGRLVPTEFPEMNAEMEKKVSKEYDSLNALAD